MVRSRKRQSLLLYDSVGLRKTCRGGGGRCGQQELSTPAVRGFADRRSLLFNSKRLTPDGSKGSAGGA